MKFKCTNPVHSETLTTWGQSCSESILLLSLTGFIWKSWLWVREKCSFIFLPEKLLNCIFPSGVKKQELKIVCDTDTLRDKKSSCFYPVADYPNLVNKKETCSQKKKKAEEWVILFRESWNTRGISRVLEKEQSLTFFIFLLISCDFCPPPHFLPPPLANCCVRLFRTF